MELSLPLLRREPRRSHRTGRVSRGGAHPGGDRGWRGAGAQLDAGAGPRGLRGWLRASRGAVRSLAGRRWALLCALVALPLAGGGWLWLRGSSLVAIDRVEIAGVEGTQSGQIEAALRAAAGRMTTLDFKAGTLRAAVAEYPAVAWLRADVGFPHTLRIEVGERTAVAVLQGAGGGRTAVAADGTVLGPALLSGGLPAIDAGTVPGAGTRVAEAGALEAATVLGAVPRALVPYAVRAYDGAQGLTVQMRGGLLVYFGDATRPHAKWMSLARVLASPSAAGAVYVDVRAPERPAAGFSLPQTGAGTTVGGSGSSGSPSSASSSSGSSSSGSSSSAGSEQTTAALAASLEAAAGTGAAATSATSQPEAEAEAEAPPA